MAGSPRHCQADQCAKDHDEDMDLGGGAQGVVLQPWAVTSLSWVTPPGLFLYGEPLLRYTGARGSMSSPPAAVVGLRQPKGPRLDVRREEDEGGRDGDGELQHSSYGVGVKVQSLAFARRPVYFLCDSSHRLSRAGEPRTA